MSVLGVTNASLEQYAPAWARKPGLAAILIVAMGLTVAGNLLFVFPYDLALPHPGPWKIDLWSFSYQELGLIKRGLAGAVLQPFGASNPVAIVSAMIVIAGVLTLVLGRLISRHADPVLALAMLLSPAVFLNIGYDIGRFDQLNLLLLLAIVFGGRYAVLLAPVMVLVHEASAVQYLPLAFYCSYVAHGLGRSLPVSAALSAAVLAVLFLAPSPDIDALKAAYPDAQPESFLVLTSSITENNRAFLTEVRGARPEILARFIPALIYLGLVFNLVRRRAWALPMLPIALTACLMPLALGIVGIDLARWTALASLNLFLLALFAAKHAPVPKEHCPWDVLLPLFLLAGPMGVTIAFEWLLLLEVI